MQENFALACEIHLAKPLHTGPAINRNYVYAPCDRSVIESIHAFND